jgi:hypothetical protein
VKRYQFYFIFAFVTLFPIMHVSAILGRRAHEDATFCLIFFKNNPQKVLFRLGPQAYEQT